MASQTVGFGRFELDLDAQELRKNGRAVKLAPQPFKLLTLLVSRPGELVTRDEIQKALWPDDTFVDFEHGINTCVKQIRLALGDDDGPGALRRDGSEAWLSFRRRGR